MRLVHLADLHLGFRQYQRLTPAGINQREADVAAAFTQAVTKIIGLAPDLVLIAGDVFHQVRPTNPALLHGFVKLSELMRALPDTDVVMVAGNHDTPRSRDTVCILRLFRQLGVHVIDSAPQRVPLTKRNLNILAVPDIQDAQVAYTPDASFRFNILMVHGEVEGLLPQIPGQERAALVVPRAAVGNPAWDYVALGHYHVHRQVGPRAWYSGSIEYTSTNSWAERREERAAGLQSDARSGKGLIEFDLERGAMEFHALPVVRPFLDLPAIDGHGLGAAELNERIAAAVGRQAIDNCVVRLVLRDVPRHVARDLDHRALRDYRRRALHFHLDVRPPDLARASASGAPGRGATLTDALAARLRQTPLDADLDRELFVATGLSYLERAESASGASP